MFKVLMAIIVVASPIVAGCTPKDALEYPQEFAIERKCPAQNTYLMVDKNGKHALRTALSDALTPIAASADLDQVCPKSGDI